jgi:hypothetical protein
MYAAPIYETEGVKFKLHSLINEKLGDKQLAIFVIDCTPALFG